MNAYSVNGVRDRCRSLDQFFIEEEFYLLIFHFLLIMKTYYENLFLKNYTNPFKPK